MGINLATADTGMSTSGQDMADEIVIVYDPDFNPHQDLQVS